MALAGGVLFHLIDFSRLSGGTCHKRFLSTCEHYVVRYFYCPTVSQFIARQICVFHENYLYGQVEAYHLIEFSYNFVASCRN